VVDIRETCQPPLLEASKYGSRAGKSVRKVLAKTALVLPARTSFYESPKMIKREIIRIVHPDSGNLNTFEVGWWDERKRWHYEANTPCYEIASLVKRELDAKRPLELPENQIPLQPVAGP
jgi:hypothetical protein